MEKMIPVESIPGIGEGQMKEKNGEDIFKCGMFSCYFIMQRC
jgi:hypothetical protein